MRISPTLSFYLMRHFLAWLMVGLSVCVGLVFMLDFVEILRKSVGKELPLITALEITFFRLPNLAVQVLPFAFLFGAILSFGKLARSRELVAIRAAGISVWQFLMPSVLSSIAIGVFIITCFNPIGAALNFESEQLQNKYLEVSSSLTSVSKSGLWLKQTDGASGIKSIITASGISANSQDFKNISIFNFTKDFDFISRIDAKDGKLLDSKWLFKAVIINQPNYSPQKLDEYSIPTNLTLAQIQDSFGAPDTMSFWELPSFINMLEQSGFSALKHRLYFQTILTIPVILAAMVLIAAVFSLKFSRRGKTSVLIMGAVLSGFLFFITTKVTASFGTSGNMPLILAAWTPAGIFILLGIWLLLHLEEE